MSLSNLYRSALTAVVLGCLMPVFALTSVSLSDGSIVRGTIVSETADFIVLNIDGADRTIPRSAVLEVRQDDGAAATAATNNYIPEPVAPGNRASAVESSAPVTASGASRIGRQTREKVSIGIDVSWNNQSRFSTENVNKTGERRSTSYLSLKPYVGIRVSDILELRPSLLFARTSTSTEYTVDEGLNYSPTSGSTETIDTSSARFGFDFGCIFYPIRGNFFRFYIGPTLGVDGGFPPRSERTYFGTTPSVEAEYDSYVDINIPLRFPIGFDFVASEHLGFRLSSEVYRFSVNIRATDGGMPNSTVDNSVVTTTSSLNLTKTLTEFGIGMFLLF